MYGRGGGNRRANFADGKKIQKIYEISKKQYQTALLYVIIIVYNFADIL